MEHPAAALARALGCQAERVCRRYLSHGRREGNYWLVGDKHDTPGRSLYVRLLAAADGGVPGKWTDAQSGEHGDLLDILRAATAGATLAEALREARDFLHQPDPVSPAPPDRSRRFRPESSERARRLINRSQPLSGTGGEAYLRERGIPDLPGLGVLRFHPCCWYRPAADDPPGTPEAMPALIATVTDIRGRVTGAHRTWLMPDGRDKAAIAKPRRAIGHLLGNGVRFGRTASVMVAGEGIETMLSIRTALPGLPAIAALSAAHLAAIEFPPDLERLYVSREPDLAGRTAYTTLKARAAAAGLEIHPLDPERSDFNADLLAIGAEALARRLRAQLIREDRSI